MPLSSRRILVIGATGQIGASLMPALRTVYGVENVVAASRSVVSSKYANDGPCEAADAVDRAALLRVIRKYGIDTIYHLAALMSASGEQNPSAAWTVNLGSLKNVLDLAVENKMEQIFYPSSIAVFGEHCAKDDTPQHCVLQPTTMYGVTKLAGENLCHYYFRKYKLDVRSVRLPGLITGHTFSGGGTTDYAVEIFFEALKRQRYTCFLKPETRMPMMYMGDAVKAIIELMTADMRKLTVRTSYNITALSFTAEELAAEVGNIIPGFVCDYVPDFRQAIADAWPNTIDDSFARRDWGWMPDYDMSRMARVVMEEVKTKLAADTALQKLDGTSAVRDPNKEGV